MKTLPRPASVSFAEALRFWLWLGCISFGGPAGQIAVMHRELVDRRRWISEGRFLHALNYCMVLPGPEAQQLATYIGWLLHGVRGGLVAGGLFVLPSLVLLTGLSWLMLAHGTLPAVAGALYGIKPAVTAIVAQAGWRIGRRSLRNRSLWAIALAAFVAIFWLRLPFPLIVLGAGLLGWVGGRLSPSTFATAAAAHGPGSATAPVLIGDGPQPASVDQPWRHLLRTASLGILVWSTASVALVAAVGGDNPLAAMSRFFSGAALVTFGGAYAVLPYVVQAAVEHYHWLSGPQMIDGLALGETTPGPLIMVVAYVGFVGSWQTQALGPDALLAAGIAGAAIASFFTFLPSFVFIFAGAPLIEAGRGNLRLTAPLTAITAAVVGVIVNLAAFFAVHVLWPDGLAGRFDATSLAIGFAALLALTRLSVSVPWVIGACGMIGLGLHLAGAG